MKRAITWKEFMFVLPLLLLVAVFSLYPIVSSFVYTLFDYQTNNQQLNRLYTKATFNAGLFGEDLEYVIYYLEKDIDAVDATWQEKLGTVRDTAQALSATYGGETGVRDLSAQEADEIDAFLSTLETESAAFLAAHEGSGLRLRSDNLPALIPEMRGCLIESNFTGLSAYARLGSDSRFGNALVNTLVFTAVSVTLELILGMALALIMNKSMRGIGLIRTTALIPWAIPTAVSALMWSYLYDGTSGIVAMIFSRVGLIRSPEMLLTTTTGTMVSAIIADVWKTTPYMALLLLAGLQVIDRGLYESSAIDGAGPVRTYRTITLPLLKPSLLVALLFRTLDAFRVYDLIQVLTKGTPETLSIYAYKMMIGQSNYGYGSVIVVAMFLCVALIAFVFVKVLGTELISE